MSDYFTDPVSAAPYASQAEADAAQHQLMLDTAASAAQLLRVQAAGSAGISGVMNGTVEDYRNLSADDQVKLTDAMAGIILQNPAMWSPEVRTEAAARANSSYYGQPLASTGYTSNLISNIADGSFISAGMGGAQKYVTTLVIIVIGLVILHALLSRPGRMQSIAA